MWKDIPLSDKQRMMELAVKSGITDLRTIEEVYNKYANGGSIHINPENKGKFTATKERTGKTTEELTHSKNPLTRKRAIFAQNAKKWHHKDLGGTLIHSFAGDDDNYLMLNPAILYANPSNLFQRAYNKLENFYWHKLRAPKDYSEEVTKEEQCAKWANQQLRNKGKQIFGNAWTRSNNPVTKVASGYDGLVKPTEYDERKVLDYIYTAANNIKKNKAFNKKNIANTLQEGDIVGLYFRNSPNLKTAFDEGINGESQTHTGNIVIENEIPYVVHNVHGNIIKNKVSDLLGSRHPYGIVSVYRPKSLGGTLLHSFSGENDTDNHSKNIHYTKEYSKLPRTYKSGISKILEDLNLNIPYSEIPKWYDAGWLNPVLKFYGHPSKGRARDNDSPTKEESEKLEDKMNIKIYHPKNRRNPNMKYAIPYLIDKEIKIKGVGRVSTNALDSLAKYAAITNTDIADALGLADQETKFGAIPYYNYSSKIDGNLINSRALGNSSYFRNYGIIPAENLVRDFRYNTPDWRGEYIDRDIPPLQHALEYFNSGNYNRGDPNHTSDIRNRGKILMQDPEIKKWIKSSEYVKK